MQEKQFHDLVARLRRTHDPLITDVIRSLDWHEHIYHKGNKPWIDCRDDRGVLYTVYPEMEDDNYIRDVFVVHRSKLSDTDS